MTPEERNMLTDLANKVAQTPAPPKDPEAEEFIRTRIGNRPDALYLMTQTVLIQNMALQQAQQQLAQMQRGGSTQGQVSSGSFLGGGSRPNYGSAPSGGSYGAPPPQQPQYSAPYAGAPSGQPSFLRGAAQTAAGVAAGALAFEGIRSLFEHPGYGGGGLMGGEGYMGGGAPQEEVVNNYYDSPSDGGDYAANDAGNYQDDSFDNSGDFGDDSNFA
ncbi:MAG TPA: DUF2076 family protein [Bryobacteraceae bacterium]|nr:DUF2076 family protein [Bryobacteraceae bacterium]